MLAAASDTMMEGKREQVVLPIMQVVWNAGANNFVFIANKVLPLTPPARR